MTIRIGLCSITFRALQQAQIVTFAAQAGLESIEWGADVHVPPGDATAARRAATLTEDAGLVACSYGSYYRATAGEDFAPVLDSASELGVDRIRVWAGTSGSAQSSDADRAVVTGSLRAAAEAAFERGVSLALEFHGGTLADSAAATQRVLDEVAHPGLGAYWQPTVGAADETAVAEYRTLADRVSAVHVFSWWPRTERLPLSAREGLWRAFFAAASDAGTPPRDALLEFVPDDDARQLAVEAGTLRRYRDAA